ncbi:MAG: methyl-accepting chemotaxis protein [Burkholderiales bacterium]
MLKATTLHQKFLLGLVAVALVIVSALSGLRFVNNNALFYKLERSHKVNMLALRYALRTAEFKLPGADEVSRAGLLKRIDTALEISRSGKSELTEAEIALFKIAGFAEVFELTDRDIEIQAEMRGIIQVEPGSAVTPALAKKLDSLLARQADYNQKFMPLLEEATRFTFNVSVVLLLLSVALLLALGWRLWRAMLPPLATATKLAERIAQGDLSVNVVIRSHDEMGKFQLALKSMNDGLAAIVREVRASSDSIVTAANKVLSGNQQLGQRTAHQASTLEQTAASMEQLAATTRSNLEQLRQAKSVAENAVDAANASGNAVDQTIQTMQRIDERSKRIVDIIGLMEGIAFQTNILALNAAVEAARAGEHGRGFAVVAQEIRQLALKSAASAKEIKGLVDDTLQVVAEGNVLIGSAGDKMRATVERIHALAELINQTALASNEQAAGIGQVNQAIIQLDEVAQHNSALVEGATAAAESQARLAHDLVERVSKFNVGSTVSSAFTNEARQALAAKKPSQSRAQAKIAPRPNMGVAQQKLPYKDPDDGDWQEF